MEELKKYLEMFGRLEITFDNYEVLYGKYEESKKSPTKVGILKTFRKTLVDVAVRYVRPEEETKHQIIKEAILNEQIALGELVEAKVR